MDITYIETVDVYKPSILPVWAGWASSVLAALAVAILFNLWLDGGCDLVGMITTSGRICI